MINIKMIVRASEGIGFRIEDIDENRLIEYMSLITLYTIKVINPNMKASISILSKITRIVIHLYLVPLSN